MTISRRSETRLRSVLLHSPENRGGPDIRKVARSLRRILPAVHIEVEPSPLRGVPRNQQERVAELLAGARVKDPCSIEQRLTPMYGEIDYELRALRGKARVGGVVYDGRRLQEVLMSMACGQLSLKRASVVFTDRLVSTFSHDDMRHHLRVIVCGFPSIISVPGTVEAPAKPRDYYILKQRMESEGVGELRIARLKAAFKGRFLEYDDPRIEKVLQGLALQAIMFHLTLKPFCETRTCVLFNAHWQEDLVESQITSGELCPSHSKLLASLGRPPVVSW